MDNFVVLNGATLWIGAGLFFLAIVALAAFATLYFNLKEAYAVLRHKKNDMFKTVLSLKSETEKLKCSDSFFRNEIERLNDELDAQKKRLSEEELKNKALLKDLTNAEKELKYFKEECVNVPIENESVTADG